MRGGEYEEACPEHSRQREVPDTVRRWRPYLDLWARVTRYSGLPAPGGIDDQEDRTMRILDIVSDEMDRIQKDREATDRIQAPSLVLPRGRMR